MNYLKNWNNMDTKDFEMKIQPFFWVDHESTASVCLNVGEYKAEIFEAREDEGFEGNGYDWESVSQRFFAASMVIAPLSASPMTSPDFNADTRVSESGMQRILKVFTLPFSP